MNEVSLLKIHSTFFLQFSFNSILILSYFFVKKKNCNVSNAKLLMALYVFKPFRLKYDR